MDNQAQKPQATKPKTGFHNHHNHKQTDKAHAVALALQRAGLDVGHGSIAGMQMPRVIRPYPAKRERAA